MPPVPPLTHQQQGTQLVPLVVLRGRGRQEQAQVQPHHSGCHSVWFLIIKRLGDLLATHVTQVGVVLVVCCAQVVLQLPHLIVRQLVRGVHLVQHLQPVHTSVKQVRGNGVANLSLRSLRTIAAVWLGPQSQTAVLCSCSS